MVAGAADAVRRPQLQRQHGGGRRGGQHPCRQHRALTGPSRQIAQSEHQGPREDEADGSAEGPAERGQHVLSAHPQRGHVQVALLAEEGALVVHPALRLRGLLLGESGEPLGQLHPHQVVGVAEQPAVPGHRLRKRRLDTGGPLLEPAPVRGGGRGEREEGGQPGAVEPGGGAHLGAAVAQPGRRLERLVHGVLPAGAGRQPALLHLGEPFAAGPCVQQRQDGVVPQVLHDGEGELIAAPGLPQQIAQPRVVQRHPAVGGVEGGAEPGDQPHHRGRLGLTRRRGGVVRLQEAEQRRQLLGVAAGCALELP
ncbi:hypothetical protein SVIO_015190 [Streptomyces violaceusniger]|uniref:Uncharacterized protein n=1 Tax=Streptomyces violaceusniger TaxID=68280 RepID=A0A4D4KVK0_STRVO|nr:hypothetical protein SVIO_015190 [Streptomyces violaceusniger]